MRATLVSRLTLTAFVSTTIVLTMLAASSLAAAAPAREIKGPATAPGGDHDHAIVLELGAVVDWERADGAVHKGGTFAFEVTPIENWLELEVGVTAVAADGGVEMPVDLLFKKPWRFSPRFEFMIGLGPELVHASGPHHATFPGIEGVLDFMFWPRRNIGWYVEPGYEITFRNGTRHRSVGVAAGLLVGR